MNYNNAFPEQTQIEEWRAIPGYEDLYEASSLGRIRRIKLYNGKCGILKPTKKRRGYLSVSLSKNNKVDTHSVHRLVLAAFCGYKKGLECNHKNGQCDDNRIINLEWVTRRENIIHSFHVLGRISIPPKFKGENHPQSVLTERDVLNIRKLYAEGVSAYSMSKTYPVSKQTVLDIIHRRTWKDIK